MRSTNAQRKGQVSFEEDFDPWLIDPIGTSGKKFPFWLSADAQINIKRLQKKGLIIDDVPSDFIGRDSAGTYRCLSWVAIAPSQYATVTTGMRAQQFPIVASDLVSQIAICELHQRVTDILAGTASPTPEHALITRLSDYERRYEERSRSGLGLYTKEPFSSKKR